VPIFFVLFVLLPLLELWLLIRVGAVIGGWLVMLWVVFAGMLGLSLLRRQGLAMLLGVNRKLQSGEMQVTELAQGVLLALAGVLLLLPGLITDSIGLVLLSPQLRKWCAPWLLRRMSVHLTQVQGYGYRQSSTPRPDERNQDIIEGECQKIDDDRNLPRG